MCKIWKPSLWRRISRANCSYQRTSLRIWRMNSLWTIDKQVEPHSFYGVQKKQLSIKWLEKVSYTELHTMRKIIMQFYVWMNFLPPVTNDFFLYTDYSSRLNAHVEVNKALQRLKVSLKALNIKTPKVYDDKE